ncbi:DUF5956 family protein [Streptomyces sp. NPDC006670]|uniref:DUF5956 family protein n=1 Tax=Streptomyces sp. NPDC006670 TaxID=3154476 RepID=UPI0033F8DA83
MSWDADGGPHPLAGRRSGRSELEPGRLPEVRELEVLGWFLAPEAPMWVFLPFVWPAVARTWIPDRSTRWQVDTTLDGAGRVVDVECHPVTEAEQETLEKDASADLARCGLPPRPADRLWMLRPVGQFDDLDAVLDHLCARADARGVSVGLSAAFVELCAAELQAAADAGRPATPEAGGSW